jgi:hypothetical protein
VPVSLGLPVSSSVTSLGSDTICSGYSLELADFHNKPANINATIPAIVISEI